MQSLLFPRAAFAAEDALAWASLHGFDHARIDQDSSGYRVEHRPRDAFVPASVEVISLPLEDDVRAVIGCLRRMTAPSSSRLTYLTDEAAREMYEHYGSMLRRRAMLGLTRVSPSSPARESNSELVRWYARWFMRTHPDPDEQERRVADAIVRGLKQATAPHALAYVRKLGYQ